MRLIITGDEKRLRDILKENKIRISRYELSAEIVPDEPKADEPIDETNPAEIVPDEPKADEPIDETNPAEIVPDEPKGKGKGRNKGK